MYVSFPQPPVISFGYIFACVVLKLLISRDLICPEYLTVELQGQKHLTSFFLKKKVDMKI